MRTEAVVGPPLRMSTVVMKNESPDPPAFDAGKT